MSKFLTGKELEDAVTDIIFDAKSILLIVSPFIKLDKYFKTLFDRHLTNPEIHLIIAFGKNEGNVGKSISREDFEYFKKFPYVSIVYIPNLHAKYYANETKGIISSINLYDFSFKNNIEFGVLFVPGLFNGSKTDKEAWETCNSMLDENFAIFVRRPTFRKKFLGKDYLGSNIHLDLTSELVNNKKFEKKSLAEFESDDNSIEIPENNKKPTREEIERIEIPIQKSLGDNKRVNLRNDNRTTGYCIRCKSPIDLNAKAPYCTKCYNNLGKYHKDIYIEIYCHKCGKLSDSTIKKPVCYTCFKENS